MGCGYSVCHSGKVYSCRLGCFGIDGAVADVQHLCFVGLQPLDGIQQSFGRGLGLFHVFAAYDDVDYPVGQVMVEQLFDAVAIFG